jgi:hypothetical protein
VQHIQNSFLSHFCKQFGAIIVIFEAYEEAYLRFSFRLDEALHQGTNAQAQFPYHTQLKISTPFLNSAGSTYIVRSQFVENFTSFAQFR